jgi:hypothetical protein
LKNTNKLLKFTLLLFFVGSVGALFAKAADTPEQTAKSFYAWYLSELNKDKFPIDQKQTMNKSISKRLSRWIYSPAYEEYGADYFIDAQDFDENWQVRRPEPSLKGTERR